MLYDFAIFSYKIFALQMRKKYMLDWKTIKNNNFSYTSN